MRITKKLTALFLTAICTSQVALGIPADPQPKQVRQPDGSMITVRICGDERAHYLLGDDGTPLFYNTKAKTFEYAKVSKGAITGSGITARNAAERDSQGKTYAANIDKQAFMAAVNGIKLKAMQRATGPQRIRINDFPTIGRQKTLVILMDFTDVKFTSIADPKQFYNDMLNKEGFTWDNGADGSARDFYLASSFNKFDPDFVVVGPVHLSQSATYYGSDDGGQDAKIGEAIVEACKAVDDEIDFSEFDADGDGYVDNIYFFYAGNGQADTPNGTDLIWPHSWYLETGWKTELTLDGKKINRYACSNELRYNSAGDKIPTGIGTFVHEFAHVLGLADHYDVSYNILGFSLGSWDTMAAGPYNNNMNTPPTFSAFERGELGWLDYEELTIDADSINILPKLTDTNKAYRVSVDGTNGREFFVMENRQQEGWDKYLPGHGMLMWHIDIDTAAWNNNTVNANQTHQRVDIVEADGIQSSSTCPGDPFPGTSAVTQWQLKSWAGDNLLKIDNVEEANDTIKMLLAGTKYVIPAPKEVVLTEVKDSSFYVTWSKVDDAKTYTLSVFTTDAGGNRAYVNGLDHKQYFSVESVLVDNLVPDTEYGVEVTASIAGYTSAVTSANTKTLDLIFAKRKPYNAVATDVNESGFTAKWDAVRDAQDYQISLFKHEYSIETKDKGYDFTDKYDGMPTLWNTSSTTYYAVKGYYGAAAPSLRLSSNNDYLIVAYPESKIDKLQLWIRSSKEGNRLHVEKAKGDGWDEIKTIDAPTAAQTISVATDGAEKVRLRLERTAGYVVIDDVVASCHVVERNSVPGYAAASTGGQTSFSFSGLEGGQTYSYRTRGVNGAELSYESDECAVTLPKTVEKDTVTIGYCNHTAATTTDIQMNGKGWTEAALRVPASALSAYSDNAIVAVNAALVNRINTDTLRVWVRKDLNGENLAAGTVVRTGTTGIVKGWNTVKLDTPYDIGHGDGDVFIGYSLHQKANVTAVSVVEPAMANTSYLKLGGADWNNISDNGVLSIEAVVAGENVPRYDLGINAVTISPEPSREATALRVEAVVHNYGAKAVEGFTLTSSAPGVTAVETHFGDKIASTESKTLSFTIVPDAGTDENTTWTVALTSLDNATDERDGNNEATATYTFLRNVLIEEFTTERCSNCPRVAGFIHELTGRSEYKGRINVVTHHSGFYTDKFTQPCDNEYLWLYMASDGSVSAPAVIVDRRPYSEKSGSKWLSFLPQSVDHLAKYADMALVVKANAVLGVTNELNADSTVLTTTVTCLKNANYSTKAPHIVVDLLENDIPTTEQQGAAGTYMQQHVTRAYNSTWGDAVEWDGNTATFTYTFNIDPTWKRENMEVLVYLYNYDSTDRLSCGIDNSASEPLIKTATGISTAATEAALHETERFRTDGRRASQHDKGIIIVRMSDGSVKKKLVK